MFSSNRAMAFVQAVYTSNPSRDTKRSWPEAFLPTHKSQLLFFELLHEAGLREKEERQWQQREENEPQCIRSPPSVLQPLEIERRRDHEDIPDPQLPVIGDKNREQGADRFFPALGRVESTRGQNAFGRKEKGINPKPQDYSAEKPSSVSPH